MGPYLTEPSAEDNEKGEAGEAYSHEDWFAIDSQELKATLSTASNHWGAETNEYPKMGATLRISSGFFI